MKSHYPELEVGLVGEGAGEECTPERFEEFLKEVALVAKAIREDLDL